MARIRFGDTTHELQPGESVLECLERCTGSARPSSCRSGSCQSCLMKATAGDVPAEAQAGLKDTWRAQGFFLACVCKPSDDLEVCDVDDEGVETPGVVTLREALSSDVVRLRIQPESDFVHTAGQFANLVRPHDRLARPYSIASLPGEALEFHVRRVEGGQLSPWLCDTAAPGDAIGLRGPSGECIYAAEPDQPLVLAGTSTGLAPLLGIVRDALARGHQGTITLHHGSRLQRGLYLADELAALAERPNVTVHRHVLEGPAEAGVQVGSLEDALLARDDLADARAWLCGAPAFVAGLKRRLFLAGVPLRNIASDAFTMASK